MGGGFAAADYTYDVFISYRHSPPVGPFVTNVLYRLFQGWLSDELESEARVFLDDSVMGAGDPLPARLAMALRQTRCLLAVCSPSYFRSPWCLAEWESFRAREVRAGLLDSLIVPVLFHEGGRVKDYLTTRIYADFTNYTYIDEALFRTEAGLGAQRAIKRLAADVGACVKAAPVFQPDWPVFMPSLPSPPLPPPGLLRLSDAALVEGVAG